MLRDLLLPLATVVTPNLPEAEILVGRSLPDGDAVRRAAREIVALGPKAVVMKGGHAAGDVVVDILFDGASFREYAAPRIDTSSTHGTGCTFASAIAAGLALGLSVEEAVAQAKEYVTAALRNAQAHRRRPRTRAPLLQLLEGFKRRALDRRVRIINAC